MYSVTIFKNIYDNKTHRSVQYESWADFVHSFKNMSGKPGSKGGHNSSPLISPAVYIKNSTRSNRNVMYWSNWVAVDVDDFHVEGNVEKHVRKLCAGYSFVCYSTASSKDSFPKFRLVFPLSSRIEHKHIRHFWFALNSEIEGMADKQTKDLARMFYVPAKYPDAYNFFFTGEGEEIEPKKLMNKWKFEDKLGSSFIDRLDDDIKERIISWRKNVANASISWTSYKDCPFFPKKMAEEYRTIAQTGWYHKMYQIMIATAGNAIKNNYPISAAEIAQMCKELDRETGNWYENRPLELEADGAIEYVYKN